MLDLGKEVFDLLSRATPENLAEIRRQIDVRLEEVRNLSCLYDLVERRLAMGPIPIVLQQIPRAEPSPDEGGSADVLGPPLHSVNSNGHIDVERFANERPVNKKPYVPFEEKKRRAKEKKAAIANYIRAHGPQTSSRIVNQFDVRGNINFTMSADMFEMNNGKWDVRDVEADPPPSAADSGPGSTPKETVDKHRIGLMLDVLERGAGSLKIPQLASCSGVPYPQVQILSHRPEFERDGLLVTMTDYGRSKLAEWREGANDNVLV